jgi:hypothetical protein
MMATFAVVGAEMEACFDTRLDYSPQFPLGSFLDFLYPVFYTMPQNKQDGRSISFHPLCLVPLGPESKQGSSQIRKSVIWSHGSIVSALMFQWLFLLRAFSEAIKLRTFCLFDCCPFQEVRLILEQEKNVLDKNCVMPTLWQTLLRLQDEWVFARCGTLNEFLIGQSMIAPSLERKWNSSFMWPNLQPLKECFSIRKKKKRCPY